MEQQKLLRDKNGLTEEEFLAAYRPGNYPRPSVAADMVIFAGTRETGAGAAGESGCEQPAAGLKLLLIRRGGHPYLGCWALPGGFVKPTETTEQAARRELKEETGVDQGYLEQLYTFSQPGRDPRTWVISCSYLALVDSSRLKVQAGDDAADAAWFDVELRHPEGGPAECWELCLSHQDIALRAVLEKEEQQSFTQCRIAESQGIAFDHGRIIASGLERLQKDKVRSKIENEREG